MWVMLIKMWSGQIIQPPVRFIDKIGNTTANMNYYADLADFKKRSLISAKLVW